VVVFAVTHQAVTHFEVPVGAAEVEKLGAALLDEVAPAGTTRGAAPLQAAAPGWKKRDAASLGRMKEASTKLYDMLVRPAVARFGMPEVLVVSATGGLRYLPFAALHDGTGWLVERTRLLAVTALDQQKFAGGSAAQTGRPSVLALADPDGSLPGARREVSELKNALGDVRIIDGAAATLAALREQIRSPGYDIVHLATHGRLDGAHPEQSHILLAGQPLYYKDIPGLRFHKTRLVVLSACDTASRGSGVEVTGLAYQFERTNVRAVVATLWPVDDAATAELMADFYKRLRDGKSPAESLALAQRTLAKQPRFQHPYYWAPFVLIGAP
jgi:CHAT domain-containing protein